MYQTPNQLNDQDYFENIQRRLHQIRQQFPDSQFNDNPINNNNPFLNQFFTENPLQNFPNQVNNIHQLRFANSHSIVHDSGTHHPQNIV